MGHRRWGGRMWRGLSEEVWTRGYALVGGEVLRKHQWVTARFYKGSRLEGPGSFVQETLGALVSSDTWSREGLNSSMGCWPVRYLSHFVRRRSSFLGKEYIPIPNKTQQSCTHKAEILGCQHKIKVLGVFLQPLNLWKQTMTVLWRGHVTGWMVTTQGGTKLRTWAWQLSAWKFTSGSKPLPWGLAAALPHCTWTLPCVPTSCLPTPMQL